MHRDWVGVIFSIVHTMSLLPAFHVAEGGEDVGQSRTDGIRYRYSGARDDMTKWGMCTESEWERVAELLP